MIRTEDLIKQAYVQLLLREGDGERRRKGEEGCRKKWEKKMRERKWSLPLCAPLGFLVVRSDTHQFFPVPSLFIKTSNFQGLVLGISLVT